MALDKKVKKAWVADLRDKSHKQGDGVLRNQWDEFCCLGRLCEVAKGLGYEVVAVEPEDDGEGYYHYSYKHSTDYEVLPGALAEDLGIKENPSVTVPHEWVEEDGFPEEWSLADINDSGKTFAEIADLIEKSNL
jgi:hypothetical protein